jgi:hypothetical protein
MTNRTLAISEMYLTRDRIRGSQSAMIAANEAMEALVDDEFFGTSQFKHIGIIFNYCDKTDLHPKGVRKSKDWIHIIISFNIKPLRRLDECTLSQIFAFAVADALIALPKKYNFKYEKIELERDRLSVLPDGSIVQAFLYDDEPEG